MKFDAILPVRNTGTRLYGKPMQLLDINNRVTIIEYLVEYIKKTEFVTDIILAIADTKGNNIYADLAEKKGWKYIFGDEIDVLDRIIKASKKFDTEIILRGSSESPFLYYNSIDELYVDHIDGHYDLTKISNLPEGAGYSINSIDALMTCHRRGSSRHRSELINSYMYDNQDQFKILEKTPDKKLCRPDVRITVDYPEDLVFCRKVYKDLDNKDSLIEIESIIDYWDENPAIRKQVEDIGIDWGHGRLWK